MGDSSISDNPIGELESCGYNREAKTTTGDNVLFLQLVISGIAQGCIYGLIALGFVLIYKATETSALPRAS
jgi:hypothetical protein